ncbi:MAG: alanine racemase [Lachnospiraceae bacterium]|nr:alanine racemase [Lachnospiraceae bacterium]
MTEETYKDKYYRVSANIDLDAICENMRRTKEKIAKGTKLMAVVKADGYGHGAVPVAKALRGIADYYAVAIVEEGIELRKAGVTEPILILGYTAPEQYEDAIHHNITMTIFQYDRAKQLDEVAGALNKKANVHIKLDTGMSRIGFAPVKESIEEIVKISRLSHVCIEGMFTHFACADMKDKTSAYKQFDTYMNFAQDLEKEGVNIPIKHVSNSAGIIDMPEVNLDMVRSGISTYGLYPSEEVEKDNLLLTPAMELKTHVAYVKEVEAGTGIGYGSTYIASEKRKIATIPVGYGDGYPRRLSGKGRVIINGQYAPIVGRICMDQFMVDVTNITDIRQGDVVTLVGRDGKAYIPVEEPADLSGSFNYEFICDIGKRVPRIYFQNQNPFLVRHD